MKKVVIIGASGFVGSAILSEALERGFRVTAIVRHPEKITSADPNSKSSPATLPTGNSLQERFPAAMP